MERLPDERLRVTRIYDIAINTIPNSPVELLAKVWLPWATIDEKFTSCRLIAQNVSGQDGPFRDPVGQPPILTRVFEEIPANDRVIVGDPGISFDQYGNKTVVIEYVQFSDGTTTYTDDVGTTAAPAPNAACILKTVEAPNDGTLIRWKLTFIDSGELSDTQRLLFNGNLILREITSLGVPPATPAGYTLVTQSIEYTQGRQVYRYGFTAVSGSGGSGGQVGQEIRYGQTITEGVTQGTTTYTLKFVTGPSVSTNPFATPAGTNLIEVGYTDDAGYRLWQGVFVKATGTVSVDIDYRPDGSIAYTHTTLSMTDATPSYPGSGTGYNTSLAHRKQDGYVQNIGVWIKPPPSVAYRRQVNFPYPGLAYFVGTQLILQPGTTRELLATVTVSYSTSQDTTTPFSISQWGGFVETYTPVATGSPVNNQFGLNGYLCTGSSSSGSGDYKGVDCSAWSYQRFASTPTSLPSGTTTIAVENEPYLTDIAGTMIFQRSVTTASL